MILQLCTGKNRRIGKNGAQEVKSHPYFAGIDFDGELRHQTAPYIPKISYPHDTSNFDPVDTDKLRDSTPDCDESSMRNGRHPEHAFFEFTFHRFFDHGGHPYPINVNQLDTSLPVEDNSESNHNPVYV